MTERREVEARGSTNIKLSTNPVINIANKTEYNVIIFESLSEERHVELEFLHVCNELSLCQ